MTTTAKLSPKQAQLLDAIKAGARIHYSGSQQFDVFFGPRDERNYIAREQTFYALRDRGLIVLDKDGVHLVAERDR